MAEMKTTADQVKKTYSTQSENLKVIRKRLNRPLTLTEKVFYGHLIDPENQNLTRGKSFLLLQPDRVAMQDATAQMALLQFMLTGREESAVPATTHCDHLIRGREGEAHDMSTALDENKEVYDFLSSVSSRYGIGFWKPGAGIIHQVILENYAFPGGLMIGTDSHTPNAGGLSMAACGVGGADACDVMAGLPWEVKNPGITGVKLTGKLNSWCSPKDVIINLIGELTVKGGTNRVMEYFGEGCDTISCTGKATITNMGAELGATCSLFPYDKNMDIYLRATGRADLADLAAANKENLLADGEVYSKPEDYYDQIIEINLSELEPHLTGPHSPDAAVTISEIRKKAEEGEWPLEVSAALIGSCTNSSYEDLAKAANLAEQAVKAGLKMKVPFFISPGSNVVKDTTERDGILEILQKAGGTVLANACGPCIGQWDRQGIEMGKKNTIVNSFNRNFRARNDGNKATLSFIGGPEMVTMIAFTGNLDFNPSTDSIKTPDGGEFRFSAPQAPSLPPKGFITDTSGFQMPEGKGVEVIVRETSDRLQLLKPFVPFKPEELKDMYVLCKAKGKCTTDHISPAGKWLKYRGHLENISGNMLTGATNYFTGEIGTGTNLLTGEKNIAFSDTAAGYRDAGHPWIIIGDDNYGEGSSREHAAMSPRFMGGAAVIAKSFARIHETNLKKQGILALTFADSNDYDCIEEQDRITLEGLDSFAPGKQLKAVVIHSDGSKDDMLLNHTYNDEQIVWYKAGSALNALRDANG
ncbi:aconitate hydratase [Spirochaeta isovalerica]|uniref:Aconitate hydratase A n=1 Tax=Spirochaeta isovalerica TaxID=150 RepID=A0A841RDP1_9SPIO|nr:aconitate hydratase [Spirochaeta isovalerica]MBB6481347.1 aconitate hydratase [Spirochaeta isovalerica]